MQFVFASQATALLAGMHAAPSLSATNGLSLDTCQLTVTQYTGVPLPPPPPLSDALSVERGIHSVTTWAGRWQLALPRPANHCAQLMAAFYSHGLCQCHRNISLIGIHSHTHAHTHTCSNGCSVMFMYRQLTAHCRTARVDRRPCVPPVDVEAGLLVTLLPPDTCSLLPLHFASQ